MLKRFVFYLGVLLSLLAAAGCDSAGENGEDEPPPEEQIPEPPSRPS
jgi:hypothetical protein